MNEDKIIEIVKDFISYIRFDKKTKYGVRKQYMAIENLLDLYQQQKQQITELQAINEEHKKINGELREENKKLSEELVEGICNKIDVEEFEKMRAELERYKKYYQNEINLISNYVSKDKIKAVVEEIKKEKNIASENLLRKAVNYAVDGAVCQELDYFQGKLEDLLEED